MLESARYRASYYEITGRIDLVTSPKLNDYAADGNPLIDSIKSITQKEGVEEPYEILVDYKGMRRPPVFLGGMGVVMKDNFKLILGLGSSNLTPMR